MSETPSFGAVVDRILAGEAPEQIRAAAARGALPLPRPVLVRLYVALREDANEEIRADATRSIDSLEVEALEEVLGDAECTPEVLTFFAAHGLKEEKLAERIAFHRAVPDAALEVLAARGNSGVIELVLTNQERLLGHARLLDLLSVNPALRTDQRGRLLELLERVSRLQARQAGEETAEEADQELDADSPEILEAAELLQVDIGELYAASEILGGEELEQSDDPAVRSAYHKILELNTSQRAILAMRGGREERMILVRDSNRLVSSAVMRNPRLNEEDVEMIARLRSVNTDVLREIGKARGYLKNMSIVTALINNPKTPPGISTNLVGRLHNHELKRIAANHDVPELIRRMAKRTIETRTRKRS